MNKDAQNRLKQLEEDIARLTGILDCNVLTPAERAIAHKQKIEAEEELALLNAEGYHWLNQVTTETRIILDQLHRALQPKVMR